MSRRAGIAVVGAIFLLAATPAEVIPVVSVQGFFIEEGSDADPAAVGAAVADARAAGGDLHVVVLAAEPASGATTFSDAVLDGLGSGTVFTVAPETVGYASAGDVWTRDELDAATEASLNGTSDTEVVTLFVSMLLDPPGGSIWPWVIGLAVVVAVVGGFVWWSSRRRRAAEAARLEAARALAKTKLAEIADDILDLEDEVQLSDDAEVRRYYEQASETYAAALTDADRATTAPDLLALSGRLDIAIWELDCAEALLDGQPLPEKPQPPDRGPSPEPRAAPTAPQTAYRRRTSRRSSYAAPDMTSMLLTMMAAGVMGRRSPRSPTTGRTTRGSSTRRSSTRIRGGGRRRRRG